MVEALDDDWTVVLRRMRSPPPQCTFNTINKWAAGIGDTLVLVLLTRHCAAASQLPPFRIPTSYWPAILHSGAAPGSCVTGASKCSFDPQQYPLPGPNLGEAVTSHHYHRAVGDCSLSGTCTDRVTRRRVEDDFGSPMGMGRRP